MAGRILVWADRLRGSSGSIEGLLWGVFGLMDEALLTKFQQAYRDFDLAPLLEPDEIAKFRVDYGIETLVRLKREIEATDSRGKFVFAGHRGCGKSTLLKRLSIDMQSNYSVVFFSIAQLIELSAVTHVNTLYAIALMLLSRATQQGIYISDDIQKTIVGWHTTQKKQISSKETKSEAGIGLNVFETFFAKLQQEQNFREEIEVTFANRISDLVGSADRIVAAIQNAKKKPVLVIIDDFDRLSLPLIEALYVNNIKSLFSPNFRIVFTIPVSAIREPEIIGSLNSEGIVAPHLFAVAKFYSREERHSSQAEPSPELMKVFLNVLDKRLPEGLIDPGVARQMVLKSGGVMRELVRLARECCTECMVRLELQPDQPKAVIDQEILKIVIRNLRNVFARQIGSNFYNLLVNVYETAETPDASDEAFVKLLHGLIVLEYENDALWYDVHPIVVEILQQKKLIPTVIP
jgi:energy-coupling factor transporter ATP-binding protein EcfA2